MQMFLRAIAAQPWAIDPAKGAEIIGAIEARLAAGPDARITQKKERETYRAAGNVAVIPVHGVIANRASLMDGESIGTGTSAERVENYIRSAYGDSDIKAIVLDMNTPGGSAAGTPELAAAIRAMRDDGRKPIVAQVNSMAASAGYWIASQASEIVATESSQVGSIGVIAVHEEISRLLDSQGVTETVITAGKYKGEGNPFQPLSDAGREHLQATVDAYYSMFVGAVAAGRNVSRSAVEGQFGQGRMMLAQAALSAGMIDRIGTMQETLDRLGVAGPGMRRGVAAKKLALAKASI